MRNLLSFVWSYHWDHYKLATLDGSLDDMTVNGLHLTHGYPCVGFHLSYVDHELMWLRGGWVYDGEPTGVVSSEYIKSQRWITYARYPWKAGALYRPIYKKEITHA